MIDKKKNTRESMKNRWKINYAKPVQCYRVVIIMADVHA